jgi:membrane peptidoglycan carboxypeptidase
MSGLGRLVLGTLLAGVLVAGLLLPYSVGVGLAANSVTTAIEDAKADPLDGEIPLRTTLTDASGTPFATLYDQNRVYVPLSSISDYLQVAVISMEDRRFYQHQGVDWRGTVRALLRNAQSTTNSPQGGSTLTQQYVKNYLYLVEAQTEAEKADAIATTPIRKLREAKMALSLEQTLSKAEILERYLNLVAFGPSQYGAEAASQWFFGVSADKLSLTQAALLAGMVNNPPKYNPLDENHVQDARDRRDLVLDVMVAAGRLSKATAEETKKQDLGLNPKRTRNGCIPAENSETNGFFCQYALDYLAAAGFDAKSVARSGWTIKTTMDPAVMASAKAAATANADPTVPGVERLANTVAIVGKDEPRKVLALAANRPYGLDVSKGQTVQRLPTTFAPLGAGSTFKVFTAAAAMESGLGTNAQIDVPAAYTSPLVPNGSFKNAGNYPARMTLAQALATSPNTAFVALEDQVGLQKVAEMAVRLGLRGYSLDAGIVDPAFAGAGTDYTAQVTAQKMASFTLGVSPVSPLELANVGATLNSDGKWCPPTPIDTITDRTGKFVTWDKTPCEQAVPAELARTLAVAMEGDLTGAGTAAGSASGAGWTWTAAGKTGTTQEYKSSAYLGFTPEMSASVILWDSEPRPQSICRDPIRTCSTDEAMAGNGVSGGSVPAATWFAAMKPLKDGQPNTFFRPASASYLKGSANTQVPNTVGKNVEDAKAQLTAAGFTVNAPVARTGTGTAVNIVVEQSPKSTAPPGGAITLYISAGGTGG